MASMNGSNMDAGSSIYKFIVVVVVFIPISMAAGVTNREERVKEHLREPHAVLSVVGNRNKFVALSDSIQLTYNLSDAFPLPANVSVRLVHLDRSHVTTGSETKSRDEGDDDNDSNNERSIKSKVGNRQAEGSKTDERHKFANMVVFSEAFLLDESQRSGELQIQCEVFDRSGHFVFQLSASSSNLNKKQMARVRNQPLPTKRRQLHHHHHNHHVIPPENVSAKNWKHRKQHPNKKQANNSNFTANNIDHSSVKQDIDQSSMKHIDQSQSIADIYKTDDDDDDDEVIGQTELFLISWPSLNVSLPHRWTSLSNLNHASLHISLADGLHPSHGDAWCEANQSPGARFSVEIRFFDSARKLQNGEHHYHHHHHHGGDEVGSVLVNSVNFSTFSQLVGIELMFNCSLFDRAGVYRAIVRSLLYQTPFVAISNPMVVRWSRAYRLLFLGTSDGNNTSSLLPCKGTEVGIRYHRPTCSGTEDRIRLYRINLVFKSRGIRQGDLVYVTEKKVSPTSGRSDWSESSDVMTNRVTFQCDLFSQSAPGYCFKYVSSTRSGFLKVQSQICLPTFYNPEFFTDGAWSAWSEWSKCSTSCGQGVQSRFRTCDNPSPLSSGRPCKGTNVETAPCDRLCPIEEGDAFSEGLEPSDYDMACPCGCQLTSDRGIINYPPNNAPLSSSSSSASSSSSSSPSSSSSSSPFNCSPRLRHRLHLQHQPIVWRIRSSRDTVIKLTYFLGGLSPSGLGRLRRSSPLLSSSSFRSDPREVRQDEMAVDTIRHTDGLKISNKRARESLLSNIRNEYHNEFIDHSGDTDYNYYDIDEKLDFTYLKKNRLVSTKRGSGRSSKPDVLTSSVKVRDGVTEDAPLLSFSTTRGQKKIVTSSGNEMTIEYQPIVFQMDRKVSNRKVRRDLIVPDNIGSGDDDGNDGKDVDESDNEEDDDDIGKVTHSADYHNDLNYNNNDDDDDEDADDTSDNHPEDEYYYHDDDDDDDDDDFSSPSDAYSFPDFQAIYISLPSTSRGAGRALFNATEAERQSYSSGFVVGVLIGSILGFLILLVLILVACRYNMSSMTKRRHVKFQVGQMLMDSCSMERSDIRLTTCQRSKKNRRDNEAEMACYTFDEAVSTSPGESPSKENHKLDRNDVHNTLRLYNKGARTLMKSGYGRSNQRGNNFANCRLSSSYSEPVLGEADYEICVDEPNPKPTDLKRPDVCPTLDQKDPGGSSPRQSLHSTTSPTSVPSTRVDPALYHLYEAVNQPLTPSKQASAILNEKDILFQYSIKHQPDGNTPTKTPIKIINEDANGNLKSSFEKNLGNQNDKVNVAVSKINNNSTHNHHSRANKLAEEFKSFNKQQNQLKQFKSANNKFLPLRKTDKCDKSPKPSGLRRNPSQSGGSRQSSCASSPSRKSNSFSGGLVAKSGHNSSGCASSSDDGLEYDDYVANLPGSYFTMDPLAYTLTWSKASTADQNGDELKETTNQYEII